MKLDKPRHRYRLAIVAISTLAFLILAFRAAQPPGEPARLKDFLFIFSLFTGPFLVLSYVVWSTRWSEMSSGAAGDSPGNRMALLGAAAGTASSVLLLLLLPFWGFVVAHEPAGEFCVGAGAVLSVIAGVAGTFGSAKLRRPAIVSVLLLPFWLVVAVLLAKATMD
jgi:hypothetical protein